MLSLVLIGGVISMVIAARRFAARKEREGAWDQDGPRHPIIARPVGADILDGGLHRAWEHQHGPEGGVRRTYEMPPILPPLDDDGAPR